ncbi:DNA glycosylase [Xylona heveae TC161]|uniref:DNA glycosylase n=1 Tax=Xylona heveae (strain CBS 132557 / TC161) TaxID=1328760 RepID=A0A165I1U9_XYLHT|nr:DNA glycosylase [Xylona heveae TC161]KZF24240.1 DNA glycosylase [Xylona heveae TC161]
MPRRPQSANDAAITPTSKGPVAEDTQPASLVSTDAPNGTIPQTLEAIENAEAHAEEGTLEEESAFRPPPSFNGRLDQFAYVRRPTTRSMQSTSTSTSAPASPSSSSLSAITSPKTRTSTRAASSATTASALSPVPANALLSSPSKRRITDSSDAASLSTSRTPSPRKKARRSPAGYAPPSRYAHLPPLPDVFAPNLICVFIGVNPGVRTAQTGHAYSHPSNLFWKLLHSSGLTSRRCEAREDVDLPRLYGLGNTNIVARPSANQSELSKAEMDAGVSILEAKIRRWRPEAVCIVGKGIWESIWRVKHGRGITKNEFRFGWQDEEENMGTGHGDGSDILGGSETMREDHAQIIHHVKRDPDWNGAKVFVATSTSGLAASLRPHEKEAIWKPLGEWAIKRRKERNEWVDN